MGARVGMSGLASDGRLEVSVGNDGLAESYAEAAARQEHPAGL